MRDEKFLAFDLSFSLSSRTSENARTFTSDLENERQNLSLIQKNRRRGKNSVQRRTKSFALSIKKNSKKQQTNFFYNRQRENNEKIRRRSPLGRNSTHHFVVLLI